MKSADEMLEVDRASFWPRGLRERLRTVPRPIPAPYKRDADDAGTELFDNTPSVTRRRKYKVLDGHPAFMFRKLQWLILLVQSGNRTTLTLSNMDIFTALVIGLIIILITLLVTVTTYVINSGLFTPISVGAGKPPIDSICFAYKFGRGPYSEVGPAFTEATCLGPNLRCLGVYYDNPEEVRVCIGPRGGFGSGGDAQNANRKPKWEWKCWYWMQTWSIS